MSIVQQLPAGSLIHPMGHRESRTACQRGMGRTHEAAEARIPEETLLIQPTYECQLAARSAQSLRPSPSKKIGRNSAHHPTTGGTFVWPSSLGG